MGTRSLNSPKIVVQLTATVRNELTDGSIASINQPSLNYSLNLTSGAEANQANRGWQSKSRSLVSGASETLDLYDLAAVDIGAGAGLDGVGQAVSPLEEIVCIIIQNDNAVTEAGQLEIIPSTLHGWYPIGSHIVANGGALKGQGILLKFQPHEDAFDVVDAASNRITLTASGGDVDYSIYILARHSDAESSSSTSSSSSSSLSSLSSSSSSSSSSISTSSVSTSSSSSSQSSSSSSSSSSVSTSSTSVSTSSSSSSTSSESSSTSSSSTTPGV